MGENDGVYARFDGSGGCGHGNVNDAGVVGSYAGNMQRGTPSSQFHAAASD